MANLALHPGLGPTQADFDNNTVLTAVNPDVVAGYAHGMWTQDALFTYAKHIQAQSQTTTQDGSLLHTTQRLQVVHASTISRRLISYRTLPQTRPLSSTRRILACTLLLDTFHICIADTDMICNSCDILVNPPRQMCGMVLPDGPSMRRHIRQEHSGARECLWIGYA